MIRSNLFLLFLLTITVMNGQQKINKRIKLEEKLSISHQIELENYQVMLDSARTSIDSAKIYNDVATVYLKSKYYLTNPEYNCVIDYANKAINLTKDDKSNLGIQQHLKSLCRIGAAYKDIGNTSKAMDYFNEILSSTETVSNPSYFYDARQLATTKIASFFATQENYELAINQYTSLFEYIKKKEIDTLKISSIVYLRYANFHREINSLDISFEYANKAKEVAIRNNKSFRVAMAYLELASIAFKKEEIWNAKMFLAKAFKLLKNTQYVGLLSEYYYIKSLLADRSSNLYNKIYYAEKAFDLLNKQTISKLHITIGNLLYEAYKENGNFKKASYILEETSSLEKKLTNNEEIKKSALIEVKRRDDDIISEQTKSKNKSNVILFVVTLFILAVITTIYIFKDRQKKIRVALEITEKNEQLKELDKVKSRFFSNISHELQTPLTLICGPIEQVLNEEKKSLDPVTKAKLQMVMKNTKALKVLINDILDLSKLKAKKLTLNSENINLHTFFNEIIQKFTLLVRQNDIKFQYCFKNLEANYAVIDTKKLEKVINNLLSNAIKYTPTKGTISVKGTFIKNKQLLISVKDTGVGISSSDIPQIFDRYFQTSDTTKPLEGGSGIGLSLVKELVELMKGKIAVNSKLGQGSIFTITIPVKKMKQKTRENFQTNMLLNNEISLDHLALETEFKTKEHTILIVEDHTGMQEFIASILQKRYKLLIANNGKEAIDKLNTNTVDLIVSDVMMPVMDGFTFLEAIKQSETHYDVPIIMLTALSEIRYKLKALTIGADDYLTKPFVSKELLARTHNLIERYCSRKKVKAESTILDVTIEESSSESTIINVGKHTKSDIELMTKVAKIIEQNIDNPDFKLNDLTEEIYLSERQLRRKIKLITGLSPKKFQQEILLSKARTLLEEGIYYNTKAVALSVGMQNTTRFSKLYEARFGKHPSDYFKA